MWALRKFSDINIKTDINRWNYTFEEHSHWRRKWQPTPVFLPGESQGWGSLVGCRLWGRTVGHDWSDLAGRPVNRKHNSVSSFPSPNNFFMTIPENAANSLFFWVYEMRSKQFSFTEVTSGSCFCKTALIWNTFHSYLNSPKDHSATAQWG